MTVLDCSVWLASHHNLNLPEQHSVQMAFQVLPHTCVFFEIVSKMLLRLNPIRIPATYRFGFLLSSLTVDFLNFHINPASLKNIIDGVTTGSLWFPSDINGRTCAMKQGYIPHPQSG
jgi:hypothetical protein